VAVDGNVWGHRALAQRLDKGPDAEVST